MTINQLMSALTKYDGNLPITRNGEEVSVTFEHYEEEESAYCSDDPHDYEDYLDLKGIELIITKEN